MPGKNSGSGPQAAVTRSDLLRVLPEEVDTYRSQSIQERPEIDTAVDTWGKIYHALVWLAAAKDPPGSNELIFLDDNGDFMILPNSHIVPAFTGSEGGSSSTERGGLIFGLRAIFDEDKDDEAGGLLFQAEAYQEYIIKGQTQPLLRHFLLKFKHHRDASGFDPQTFNPQTTRTRCQDSTLAMDFHNSTAEFVEKALGLIQALWGENIGNDLKDVNKWLADDPLAGEKAWLDTEFGIKGLNVSGLFDNNNIEGQKGLNNAKLAFSLNREIYGFVYDRFVDLDDGSLKSDGLEQIIAILTSQLADQEHSKAWAHLITATYGAVAMKIYKQTERLVNRAKQILP